MHIYKYMKRIKISPLSLIFLGAFFIWDFSFYTVLTMVAAVFHEIGHIIAMNICGVSFKTITLHPFGADIQRSNEITSYKTDITVSLGGIAANIMAAIFMLPFSGNHYIFFLIACNVALALLNALPIKTLDGGEALEAMLLLVFPSHLATNIVRSVSFVFIILLWCIAVYALMFTRCNISLFLICVYLFSTIFLKSDSDGII